MSSGATTAGAGVTGRLRYEVTGDLFVLRGEINENSDLEELRRRAGARVELDLAGIERINSCGVREWINFIKALTATEIVYRSCSPAVVSQLNTVVNFRGPARVETVLAPYACLSCGREVNQVLEVELLRRTGGTIPEPIPCTCGDSMEFDEVPERYFTFLKYL